MKMDKTNKANNRREFIKKCSLFTVPFVLPVMQVNAKSFENTFDKTNKKKRTPINFISDGFMFSPNEYLNILQEINQSNPIESDFYGDGGATKLLEDEFARLTGKEKAIYLPTGTMANQLAIKLLSESNTKVIVPENSHIYRDEADAAQSVHGKRLIPIGEGKSFYDLAELKNKIDYLENNEVFNSGLGAVVIENPIRRADGTFVPIDDIKEISSYCKANNYKMHLDGARIHLASAYSKVSLSEYASYFDTVYISLYKYLNASGGAILCGNAKIIDQISHQIKILGGTVFQNWNNTSVALHYLNGISERWNELVNKSQNLISELNKIEGIHINSFKNGTNIYDFKLMSELSYRKFAIFLDSQHDIWLSGPNDNGIVKLTINESLLTRDNKEIILAWRKAVEHARN
jgi:threonine aldolase